MKKKFVFRLWLIIIASFVALNVIVYQFIRAFYNERGNEHFLAANQFTALDFQQRINAYLSLLEFPDYVHLHLFLPEITADYASHFDELFYFTTANPVQTNDGRFINSLLASEFNQEGISIEKENLIFTNSTINIARVYFKKFAGPHTFVFSKKITDFLVDSSILLFKNDGHLLYPNETYGSQFFTLLENSNSLYYAQDFVDRLRSQGSLITSGKINGSNMIITASEVQESSLTNRMYIANFTTEYAFAQKYLPLLYMTIAELVVYSLLVLFIIIYVLQSLNKSNNDITNDMRSFKDDNIFYLSFDKKGRLRHFNRTFRMRVRQTKLMKRIENFQTEDGVALSIEKLQKMDFTSLKLTTIMNKTIVLRATILKRRNQIVLFAEDMTRQLSNLNRIEKLAFHHPITRLPNIHRLEDEVEIANTNDKDFTLIAFDVQNFRHVNNMFGRNNGDTILIEIASRLANVFSHLFHIEGDLFVGFYEGKIEREEIPLISKNIGEQFSRPLVLGESKFEIDFRIGAFIKEDNVTFKIAYESLMQALKTAKENTNQKFVIYDINIGAKVTREILLQHQLQNALANDEFKVYFQPQVDLTTNKIVALESLIRWINPHYIGESPQLFIEMAEKNNMIIPIGHFVLLEALKVAKVLEPFDIKISVNVSPLQIFQTGYVQEITAMFEKFNLAPNTIALELTETAIMESYTEIVHKLNSLRDNGFSIHLDDFGEGYSSFAYLKTLPADALKISYNFTKNIVVDKASATIVKEMISLAKNFDKTIICEGIETEAHAKLVTRYGCNIGQGYWFSRPVPFEEIKILLKKHNDIDV